MILTPRVNQRATLAAAPGSRRGKSGPPARALTVTLSPEMIRTTANNRVGNQLFRTFVAIAAAAAIGTPAGPIYWIVITPLTGRAAFRIARWMTRECNEGMAGAERL